MDFVIRSLELRAKVPVMLTRTRDSRPKPKLRPGVSRARLKAKTWVLKANANAKKWSPKAIAKNYDPRQRTRTKKLKLSKHES